MSTNGPHPRRDHGASPEPVNGKPVLSWNGQRLFDWIEPSDLLRSLIRQAQAERTVLLITIIEHQAVQPSSQAGATDKRIDAVCERLGAIEECLAAVCERLERAVVPLAEENRALRNEELDLHVVRPLLEIIIQVLGRLDDELREGPDEGAFGILRAARQADREEYHQILRHFGVTAKHPKRGDRFSPSVHKVISRQATASANAVGRLRRVMRPAYIRERNGQVIEKAWVEVYVQAVA